MATVEELVNNLYEMVQDAGAVPFTDKCMLERDRVLDMLDELRVSLPARHQDGAGHRGKAQ